MRLNTIRRRLRASGFCDREIWNIYNKMKGKPDKECVAGKKYSKDWVKAIEEAIVY